MINRLFKQSLLALSLVLLATSCSDRFGDDLRSLGSRVEELEKQVLQVNKEIEALSTIIRAIQSHGYISNIIDNGDGTYKVEMTYFENPDDPNSKAIKEYILHNGKDKNDEPLNICVKTDPSDGLWYWWVDNDWLLDENNEKVRVGGKDGVDGTTDEIFPKVRINHTTGFWEIFNNGNWETIGGENPVRADGTNGGPALIQDIWQEDDVVYIKLNSGIIIPIPAYKSTENS